MGCTTSIGVKSKESDQHITADAKNGVAKDQTDVKEQSLVSRGSGRIIERLPGCKVDNEQANDLIINENKNDLIDSEREKEDVVEPSIKIPAHKKEHATQETLNFVYRNSLRSRSNGNIPTSNSLIPNVNRNFDRRPSGVPPPARALKPGDFLYQKTMNTVLNSNIFEG